jgi:hypothetical protein
VSFAIGNDYYCGNAAAQIEQGVQFECTFVFAKPSLREKRETEIDRCCSQCLDGSLEMKSELGVDVETAGHGNQQLREVGIDAPVAHLICIGQGISRNSAAKTHVIEFVRSHAEASFDISQTLAISQLRKSHCKEPIPTGEALDLVIAIVALDAFSKFVCG